MGYFKLDNSASGGSVIERDTTHCRHCQAVILKPLRIGGTLIPMSPGGYCRKCDGDLCEPCAKRSFELGMCEPWKKKIDDELNAVNKNHSGILILP